MQFGMYSRIARRQINNVLKNIESRGYVLIECCVNLFYKSESFGLYSTDVHVTFTVY